MYHRLLLLLFTTVSFLSAHNKFILTGGPCCGKTSVIRELAARGYQVCPEAYTQLYKEYKAAGKLDLFLVHNLHQRWLLLKQHILQESVLDASKPAFLDRSVPDVIFYGCYLTLEMSQEMFDEYHTHKAEYDIVFFFEPLPRELYYSTEVRYESYEEAQTIHQILLEHYIKHNFHIVHVPFDTVERRADFVLQRVQQCRS